jgi:hypothetical protein
MDGHFNSVRVLHLGGACIKPLAERMSDHFEGCHYKRRGRNSASVQRIYARTLMFDGRRERQAFSSAAHASASGIFFLVLGL